MLHYVAEFLHHLVRIVPCQCVSQLINLLYRVRSETLDGLFPIPRALLSQSVLHVKQSTESFQLFFSCMHLLNLFDAKLMLLGGNFVILQSFLL